MRKILAISALTAALFGCGSTSYYMKPPLKVSSASSPDSEFVYEPNGRKEFVFGELDKSSQYFGYEEVCLRKPTHAISIACAGDRLPYEKYYGKKGYYTDSASFTDSAGFTANEVILEAGEIVYLLSSSRYKSVGRHFISKEEWDATVNFQPRPIVEGASVMLTGFSEYLPNNLMVSSQNGHSFSPTELDAIRKIANTFPENKVEIAELLSTMHVTYDDFSGFTRIKSAGYNNPGSYLLIEIAFKDGQATSFMSTQYKADDWLFVKSFSTSADGEMWDSGKVDFKRDHDGGTIWEWQKVPINADNLSMLKSMTNANKAVVRFYGKDYYDDYTLTDVQKSELRTLTRLVELMK